MKITIEKTGEMLVGSSKREGKPRSIYTPVYEIVSMPDIVFDVIANEDIYNVYGALIVKKGTVVDTLITGTDGKSETKLLHLGKYLLVEKEVPYGFVALEPIEVILGFDGEITDIITKSISIFNERQKAELIMNKVCEIPAANDGRLMLPEDYPNPYQYIKFALYAKEDVVTAAGEVVIPAGSVIEYFGVDENGVAQIKTDLPFGTFYVRELETALGYVLDENIYQFSFDYDVEKPILVEVPVNDGSPIANLLERGSLKIIKTFEGVDTPIEGVEFTITGTSVGGVPCFMKVTTDKNGEIVLGNLLPGEYTVQEIASDLTVGYVLSEEQTMTVAADEITKMRINNKLIRGNIRIIKTDKDTGKALPGAVFGLYDKSGNFIDSKITGWDGSAEFNDIIYGEYTIKEISAPDGYKLLDTAFSVTVDEDGKVFEVEISNEKVPQEPVTPGYPSSPKTSDKSNSALWIIAIGVSVIGIVGLGVSYKRKKKSDTEDKKIGN